MWPSSVCCACDLCFVKLWATLTTATKPLSFVVECVCLVCVSVLVCCCSVSSLFLSCVLCACDLLIVDCLNYGLGLTCNPTMTTLTTAAKPLSLVVA